jgi:hypothetical protein
MTRPVLQPKRFQYFLLSVCLVFLSGCIGNKRVTTVVHEEKNRAVTLESRLGKDKKPIEYGYQHPENIAQKDFEKLLFSVYIKQSKTLLGIIIPAIGPKDREHAFSQEEIIFLSPHLSNALARAKPNQRVTFMLSRPRGAQIRELTSGAIFIRDGRLNLVLANDRTVIDRENMAVADEDDPLYVYEQDGFKILPVKHQRMVKADRALRDQEGELPKNWVVMDYREILASQPVQPEPSLQSPAMQSNPPGPALSVEPAPASPIEEKLRVLKRLREEGLITEEEYQIKRKELLKEF